MLAALIRFLRSCYRAPVLVGLLLCTWASYPLWVLTSPMAERPHRRTRWFQFWCRRCAAWMRLRLRTQGSIPAAGLLVSNHLGYLDVLVLSCLTPCVFVSKTEVRSWPLFGQVATLLGTIFVDRRRTADLKKVVHAIQATLAQGVAIVLFPEGTSSNGQQILPFRSSILAAAEAAKTSITPIALHYLVADGRAADTVCYWGEMTFAPHLWKLLGHAEIEVRVSLGEPIIPTTDRKALTLILEEQVRRQHLKIADASFCATGYGC